MMAGENYNAGNPVLYEAQVTAHELSRDYSELRLKACRDLAEFRLRRQQLLGSLLGSLGANARIESIVVDFGFNTAIGRDFTAGSNLTILDCEAVTIGHGCNFGNNVVLCAADHPVEAPARNHPILKNFSRKIIVGDNVVLGSGTIVLAGITIGSGAVVGAGSVVTRSVPAGSVVAGKPARPCI